MGSTFREKLESKNVLKEIINIPSLKLNMVRMEFKVKDHDKVLVVTWPDQLNFFDAVSHYSNTELQFSPDPATLTGDGRSCNQKQLDGTNWEKMNG